MKVELWVIGKINECYLGIGIEIYIKWLKYYLKFEFNILFDVKKVGKLSLV